MSKPHAAAVRAAAFLKEPLRGIVQKHATHEYDPLVGIATDIAFDAMHDSKGNLHWRDQTLHGKLRKALRSVVGEEGT